jgi:outer membrane beta-barrel protein
VESRVRVLLLSAAFAAAAGCATQPAGEATRAELEAGAETDRLARIEEDRSAGPAPRVIEPEVERRRVRVPRIDPENIELGTYAGALSVEDFGTAPVFGLSAAFHVTEDFFLRAEVGRASVARENWERMAPEQFDGRRGRCYSYYNLALGYNALPGEIFLGRGRAMNSALYVTAGVGGTRFACEDHFTVSLGAGYRVVPTNWLALHLGVQDRLFQSDLLGSRKLRNNIEAHFGVTVFF